MNIQLISKLEASVADLKGKLKATRATLTADEAELLQNQIDKAEQRIAELSAPVKMPDAEPERMEESPAPTTAGWKKGDRVAFTTKKGGGGTGTIKGIIENPKSGNRYQIDVDGGVTTLTTDKYLSATSTVAPEAKPKAEKPTKPKTEKKPAVAKEKAAKKAKPTQTVAAKKAKKVKMMDPLPEKMLAGVVAHTRTDCDEHEENVLLAPVTEKMEIDVPLVAQPGDKILLQPDGTPMAVIKKSEIAKHFEPTSETEIVADPTSETGIAVVPDESVELQKPTTTKPRPEKDIERKKPTPQADYLKKSDDLTPLEVWLEGMVKRWKAGDTDDKVTRLGVLDETGGVVAEITTYYGIGRTIKKQKWFKVCAKNCKMTLLKDDPTRADYRPLISIDALKEVYENGKLDKCREVAKKVYECLGDGGCKDADDRQLFKKHFGSCGKSRSEGGDHRAHELNIAHAKWVHAQVRNRWSGYEGEKSYYAIYREVVNGLRNGSVKPV